VTATGHARAGAFRHCRAAGALRLVYRAAAAGRLSVRGGSALALAGAALLAHAGASLLTAGAALLPRARAGPGILRLRELEAAGCWVGRPRDGDSKHCRGPAHQCEYSHLSSP